METKGREGGGDLGEVLRQGGENKGMSVVAVEGRRSMRGTEHASYASVALIVCLDQGPRAVDGKKYPKYRIYGSPNPPLLDGEAKRVGLVDATHQDRKPGTWAEGRTWPKSLSSTIFRRCPRSR